MPPTSRRWTRSFATCKESCRSCARSAGMGRTDGRQDKSGMSQPQPFHDAHAGGVADMLSLGVTPTAMPSDAHPGVGIAAAPHDPSTEWTEAEVAAIFTHQM